jgi:hypothetical protein
MKLWKHEHHPLPTTAELLYKITDIDCIEVKGVNDFVFVVSYKFYENNCYDTLDMKATIHVKNYKVLDKYKIE